LNLVPQYDELEFEHLHQRLRKQQGNAFFCVTVNPVFSQAEIAKRMCEFFPDDTVQIIDFNKKHENYERFSSDFLRFSIREGASIVFLVNFQSASGEIPDIEFFQALNQSRDVLAQLPVVLVFMMPLYFRIQIARNAPDFNSFFGYRADFAAETQHTVMQAEPSEQFSVTKSELLNYYKRRYITLTNHESKEAFETILNILKLNASVRTLFFVDLNRFYEAFVKLLPLYQNEYNDLHSDIAYVFNSQGDYAKALEWYLKALDINEKILGNEHPDTATTYNNIASVYNDLGAYKEALEWYKKALDIDEKVLGKEHPYTATTYSNIAKVYHGQGDYKKALDLDMKALDIREKVLGKEHFSTAITYNNIACAYNNRGDHKEALEWHQKALNINEKVFGKEHPYTATTYSNIASVYYNQGDYKEALKWYKKALDIDEKVLGKEHPYTARTYNNIASVYYNQGEYKKALDLYQNALDIRKKVLGEEHPDTAKTYNHIANLYKNHGDDSKALDRFRK